MIDYLVPSFLLKTTGSGGMRTKIERVRRAAASRYQMHAGSDLSAMCSDFLLIEPLYFRMEDNFDLEALRLNPAKKVLYCSEMEMFRWTGSFRKELLGICDVVTCNCDYQASLFRAVGIEDSHRLIDPIPENDFEPLPKKLRVVAMGLISKIKNSGFVAELFKRLATTPMETVYVGGASLWSEASEADLVIEAEIREYADLFHENIRPELVPRAIGAASFFTASTIHDVSACCHAEALMSGCISVSCNHPVYSERPGFICSTVEGVLDRLASLTDGYAHLPDEQLSIGSRDWAASHVSFDTFQGQLTGILSQFYD